MGTTGGAAIDRKITSRKGVSAAHTRPKPAQQQQLLLQALPRKGKGVQPQLQRRLTGQGGGAVTRMIEKKTGWWPGSFHWESRRSELRDSGNSFVRGRGNPL